MNSLDVAVETKFGEVAREHPSHIRLPPQFQRAKSFRENFNFLSLLRRLVGACAGTPKLCRPAILRGSREGHEAPRLQTELHPSVELNRICGSVSNSAAAPQSWLGVEEPRSSSTFRIFGVTPPQGLCRPSIQGWGGSRLRYPRRLSA